MRFIHIDWNQRLRQKLNEKINGIPKQINTLKLKLAFGFKRINTIKQF